MKVPELSIWKHRSGLRVRVLRNVTFRKQSYVQVVSLNDGVRSAISSAMLLNEFEEIKQGITPK